MCTDPDCRDKNFTRWHVENLLAEKARLEALQRTSGLCDTDEEILSILDKWMAHYVSAHTNQA